MAQQTEVKAIMVEVGKHKVRINEGEQILLLVEAPRRTDICTVYRLNAKDEVDVRQFWMPDSVGADGKVPDYYVPTGKAAAPASLDTLGLVITQLNAVLAARAAQGGAADAG